MPSNKPNPKLCKVPTPDGLCNRKIGRGHGDGKNYKGNSTKELCTGHEARERLKGDVLAHIPLQVQDANLEKPKCLKPDCDKEARGRTGNNQYCNPHRLLSRRHGRTHTVKKSNIGKTCSIEGCNKMCESGADKFADGKCPNCYKRVSGKASECQSRRRARKANTECDGHTIAELHQYWRDRDIEPKRCTYCDAWHTKWKNNWKTSQGDHVVPLFRGGTNLMSNLMPACGTCNSKKGTKLLSEWTQPKHEKKAA